MTLHPGKEKVETQKKWREGCGIFGVFGHPEASTLTYLGLHALQHRGQESAGIVTWDGSNLRSHRAMGLVQDIFTNKVLKDLPGEIAVGHVRYSTTGKSILKNAQPLVVEYARGALAIAHNGNLVNAKTLRRELEEEGAIFQSTTDTEVVVHLISRSQARTIEERILSALRLIKGAYSFLILTEGKLFAIRDPYGFRPLVVGEKDSAIVIGSETCAFPLVGARYVEEIPPGIMRVYSPDGVEDYTIDTVPVLRPCIFEYVYFSRPDSIVFGKSVYEIRKALGRQLAREAPAQADLVIPVPDSGLPAAIGYSQESGIPFDMGLIRSHYVGRTFIEPEERIRYFGVRLKLNAVEGVIRGKRVVVIDDSIVRGTTGRKIIELIREAGAKEVHLRISSPPITHPCFYGIDTPTKEELIAHSLSEDEIARFLNCDSLRYLSLQGLLRVAKEAGYVGWQGPETFCSACFTGEYPVPVEEVEERQMQLFEV
jgi:amidophosphoribosyltransferase